MIKRIAKMSAIFATVALMSASAFAVTGDSYAGVKYQLDTYKEQGTETLNPSSVGIQGGYYFTDNFAVEVQYSLSVSDDKFSIGNGVDAKLEVKNSASIFLKADLPVTDDFGFYTKVGYSHIKLDVSANIPGYGNVSVEDSESSESFGVGAQARITDNLSLVVDYTSFAREYAYNYSAFSVGLNKRF